ncbi:MAG: S-layer homology domain-containing protein [Oscillospiraceae bacterium]|nr:S-layer homology domain-containing protein [Oscillospiraceae bacterium]
MKKAKALLCATFVLALLAGTVGAAGWADWADERAEALSARQIFGLIADNSGELITREAFCVMLARAALEHAGEALETGALDAASVFADAGAIAAENAPYVMYLFEQGILNGAIIQGNRYMLPGDLLTRQDAVAFLGRWLGLDSLENDVGARANLFADDSDIAAHARNVAYQIVGMGFLTVYPDGSFRPGGNMSYAEAASIMLNILGGRTLATYAGDGHLGNADGAASEARFALPSGLSLDNDGNLVVFDTFNAGVRIIDSQTRRTETLLGFLEAIDDYGFIMAGYVDGAREVAMLGRPTDGVFAANGDLFIADSVNHAIRMLRGGTVYTFAGGERGFADGSGDAAMFDNPVAIAIDDAGNIYVADSMNHAIRRITPTGEVSTVAGETGRPGHADGSAAEALFTEPSGIAIGQSGAIFVADKGNQVIRKIENGTVSTIAGMVGPMQMGEYSRPGGYENGAAALARFNFPGGLFYREGVLLIADTGNHVIRALINGSVMTIVGNSTPGYADGIPGRAAMNRPSAITMRNSTMFIADTLNNTIRAVEIDIGTLMP